MTIPPVQLYQRNKTWFYPVLYVPLLHLLCQLTGEQPDSVCHIYEVLALQSNCQAHAVCHPSSQAAIQPA